MTAEHFTHPDPAVRDLIAEAEVRGAVRALREAADDYLWRDAGGDTSLPGGAKHWLRDRADRIEATR